MKEWVRTNKLRLIFSLIGISALFLLLKLYFPEKPTFEDCALQWFIIAFVFASIMSGIPFLIAFFKSIYIQIREKRVAINTLSQGVGTVLGFFIFIILIGVAFFLLFGKLKNIEMLHIILIILALCVGIVDFLLLEKEREAIIELDFIIFISLLLTYILKIFYPYSPESFTQSWNPDYFLKSWWAGATGFQIILVNLLFDPAIYLSLFDRRHRNEDE